MAKKKGVPEKYQPGSKRAGASIFRRNVVERGFNQLKEWRGIASRTDKHAINYRGAITFRATLAWIS